MCWIRLAGAAFGIAVVWAGMGGNVVAADGDGLTSAAGAATQIIILNQKQDELRQARDELDDLVALAKSAVATLIRDQEFAAPENPNEDVSELKELKAEFEAQKSADAATAYEDLQTKYDKIDYDFSSPYEPSSPFPLEVDGRTYDTPKGLMEALTLRDSDIPPAINQDIAQFSEKNAPVEGATAFAEANKVCDSYLPVTETENAGEAEAAAATRASEAPKVDKLKTREAMAACATALDTIIDYIGASRTHSAELFKNAREILEGFQTALENKRSTVLAQIQAVNADMAKAAHTAETSLEAEKGIPESAVNVIIYTLVGWGSIVFTVVVAVLLMGYMSQRRAAGQTPGEASKGNEFSYLLFLEMMTVFLLTGAILILGLGSKLNQEGLAALIGGISGYVLGRMRSVTPQPTQ